MGCSPNFTTNGRLLNHEFINNIKNKIGAIAISSSDILRDYPEAITLLKNEGIKVNLHYVLSMANISQAVKILRGEFNHVISNLNSIVFLTHKAMGRANPEHTLKLCDDVLEFLKLLMPPNFPTRIGFDACFVPILLHCVDIDTKFVDSCECGFFSVYIDEKLNVMPCSFSNTSKHSYNLREHTMQDIWESKLSYFRSRIVNNCKRSCSNADLCKGACPYYDDLILCFSQLERPSVNG